MKNWRERWCVLTQNKLYCFKEKYEYSEETEAFHLINHESDESFNEYNLIKSQQDEIIFELINSKEKISRKFKIIDKLSMNFYTEIKNVINKKYIENNNNIDDKLIDYNKNNDKYHSIKMTQTLICGYIHFDLKIKTYIIPKIIIELCYKYGNEQNNKAIIALFFKNKGLQIVPFRNDTSFVMDIQISTISCNYPQYFKKWNIKNEEIRELQQKYHQITYVKNIKYSKLPKLFINHKLFIKYFGKYNNNLSIILTSYFSFIIIDNKNKEKSKGIEFILPNIDNNYQELLYWKMEFSENHGLIAYKDLDIYKLNINAFTSFDEIFWKKLISFPESVSLSSLCWLTENKLFLCGKSAIILDIKKGKYYQLNNQILDEFILFPSALKYDFNANKVYNIGGSHSNKAQFYDINNSKWYTLNKTNYSHSGKDCPPMTWFIKSKLYICSYYNGQLLVEYLDTNYSRNKWIISDNSKLAKYLDFNVWILHIS